MRGKLLIIGHGRHGKDTVAEMIKNTFGLTYESSSAAALRLFVYDALKDKYSYQTPEECYADRANHRAEWYDLICDYNKHDRGRLAKGILATHDMYVGMRDNDELQESLRQGIFDKVVTVFDPRKPLEPEDSLNIDIFKNADIILVNNGTLDELAECVKFIFSNNFPVIERRRNAKNIKVSICKFPQNSYL